MGTERGAATSARPRNAVQETLLMPEPRKPNVSEPGRIAVLTGEASLLDEEYRAALGTTRADRLLAEWGEAMDSLVFTRATTVIEFRAKAHTLLTSIDTRGGVSFLEDDHGVGASLIRDLCAE